MAKCASFSGRLVDGVFLAVTGQDAVILDLQTDTYGCLPEIGSHIVVDGRNLTFDEALSEPLKASGLLSDTRCAATLADVGTRFPHPPTTHLPLGENRRRTADAVAFLSAVRRIGNLGPDPAIRTLLGALPTRPKVNPDRKRVAAAAEMFRTLLPWTPHQGACLYRAFVLLSMLRRSGQDAAWVFGVRIWPFSAHCWLQFDDAVLDDDPERIGLYTPIMVA